VSNFSLDAIGIERRDLIRRRRKESSVWVWDVRVRKRRVEKALAVGTAKVKPALTEGMKDGKTAKAGERVLLFLRGGKVILHQCDNPFHL